MMSSRVVQITTSANHVWALCEDGSVWKKSINADGDAKWDRFG